MDYIVSAFSMLALDGIYLSSIGGTLFGKMVKNIQKEEMTINLYGAIGCYILLVLVLYKFIIMERKHPRDAFILGLCVYGVFDFTNIAIFKNYKWFPAIVDTLWGGILFYLVTFITYKIMSIRY
jgi:uncharacterized membrane protein